MALSRCGSEPLRERVSSAYQRVRRVFAPAGESLSFVAPNESNQSKGALHLTEGCGYKLRPMRRHAGDTPHTCCDFSTPRFASARME